MVTCEHWSFIERYLPDYYSNENVLVSDILFRYLTGEEVSSSDQMWIQTEFNDRVEILAELIKIDTTLFSKLLTAYYCEQINLK